MEAGTALVAALVDAGVDTAFTVPGESFLSALEALRVGRNRVRLVSVRHEGGGALAAHGYGQFRGFPAAVFVSRGPGATNASIGLHAARQDSVPLVLFMGQVRSRMAGREAFQEIDPASAFASMAKAVLQPQAPEDLPALARRAVEVSIAGRPGPVVVAIPRDFGEAEVAAPAALGPVVREPVEAAPAAVADLARAVDSARRPLLLAGELARGPEGRAALERFAEASGAPVLCAYRCQDALDNRHPAWAGHLEINPVAYQQRLVEEADLVVVAGARLDGITGREETLLPPGKDWAHIHPDEEVLERFAAPRRLRSDAAPALEAAAAALAPPAADRLAWRDAARANYLAFAAPGSYPVRGAVDLSAVAAAARESLPDEAVVLTDGGSYARWIHRFFPFRGPRTQGGTASGAMGAGVPGALGAALAANDGRPVVAFCGDGGFAMTGQELSTAAREGVAAKIVVCDNGAHGSILKGQLDKYGEGHAFATILESPDFARLAEGYGARAWTARTEAEWRPALRAMLAHDGPALLRLLCDPRDIAPYGAGKDAV